MPQVRDDPLRLRSEFVIFSAQGSRWVGAMWMMVEEVV
jgi:hypothetical protein